MVTCARDTPDLMAIELMSPSNTPKSCIILVIIVALRSYCFNLHTHYNLEGSLSQTSVCLGCEVSMGKYNLNCRNHQTVDNSCLVVSLLLSYEGRLVCVTDVIDHDAGMVLVVNVHR